MNPRTIIWTDGIAGATVGLGMLVLLRWLPGWYQLPFDFLLLVALANTGYGAYSLSLARRATRPMGLIVLLVAANALWGVLCLRWVLVYRDTASFFGLAHLAAEGLFVGGLALVEWRWREQLRTT